LAGLLPNLQLLRRPIKAPVVVALLLAGAHPEAVERLEPEPKRQGQKRP